MNANQAKFDKLREKFVALDAKRDELRGELARKYGPNFSDSWLTAGERKKLDALRERADKASDAFFDFLDTISPRSWRSGVSFFWVLTKLTYADATTRGELSVPPLGGWGATPSFLREFARPV